MRISKITLLFPIILSACMTYGNYPNSPVLPQTTKSKVLNYKIDGNAMFAGPTAIRDVLADSEYEKLIPAEEKVNKGDYLSVDIKQVSPSVPAVVFGYISAGTFTILPFWSTEDGSILTYSMYRNGTKIKAKEYVINRSTFVWLPMALLAWVNVLTPSEEAVFRACTRDFLTTANDN